MGLSFHVIIINSFGTSLLLGRVSLQESRLIISCSGWGHYQYLKLFLSLITLTIHSKHVSIFQQPKWLLWTQFLTYFVVILGSMG
jgi:hypothetical protein